MLIIKYINEENKKFIKRMKYFMDRREFFYLVYNFKKISIKKLMRCLFLVWFDKLDDFLSLEFKST